jgi:hypothetical protein
MTDYRFYRMEKAGVCGIKQIPAYHGLFHARVLQRLNGGSTGGSCY